MHIICPVVMENAHYISQFRVGYEMCQTFSHSFFDAIIVTINIAGCLHDV